VPAWLMPALALGMSASLTHAWIALARRRNVMDTPERRRLHDVPTPRGGGIGPVVSIVLVLLGIQVVWPEARMPSLPATLIALTTVAGVSFVDDHRPLSIRLRLGMHMLAAAMLAVAHIAASGAAPGQWTELFLGILLLSTASMNLHNFMDGSDAHLASQALFVFAVLTLLAHGHGAADLRTLFVAAALAMLAFLPFNWPRARVFLGDVGSISLGLLVAAFSLLALQREAIGWGGALVLSSTFMIDALATLVGRMRRTRHWLRPHRDHLYQWLRRRGWSAAGVVVVYQGWNVLVVVPVIVWLDASERSPQREFAATVAVYALGLGTWCAARGALRRSHRAQYRP
jgi:UDP-N-acetylmuramyl pentapeptide phosphotransferase/UDP-N-acetylglucosamine-1-phosphate transferase